METWLRDHLIRTGHITETGVTRAAKIRGCPMRCGSFVLVGLDDAHQCALEARADPIPVSALGEALALVEGRRTWSLHREAGRWVLDPRDDHHIAGYPAGTRLREDVLREHRCGIGVPTGALAAASTHPDTRPPLPAGAEPGF